jgi:Fe2+ or Zn2+ uptake regulation protein
MDLTELLKQHGILPSAQRIAVAEVALAGTDHRSADEVFKDARQRLPVLSRATVYNTLNLLVQKGLLRTVKLGEGSVLFDPKLEPHHHFVDDETGRVHDIPWASLAISSSDALGDLDVREYQVILRGKRKDGGERGSA